MATKVPPNHVKNPDPKKLRSNSLELEQLSPSNQQTIDPKDLSNNQTEENVSESLTDDEEEEYYQLRDGTQHEPEPEFFCICGLPLRRYPAPQGHNPSNSNSAAGTPQPQSFRTAYKGWKKIFQDRMDSLTRLDGIDDIDDDTDDDDDHKDQKQEENDKETMDKQQKHEETKERLTESIQQKHPEIQQNITDSKEVKVQDIEDGMTKHIALQQTDSNKEKVDAELKLDEFIVSDKTHIYGDESEEDEEEKYERDNYVEDSQRRHDIEEEALKQAGAEQVFSRPMKERDEYINILCLSCDCDMNDEAFKRYECDDVYCYTKKFKGYHVQYCLKCYKQLNALLNMKKHDEEYMFREDGFEIRTETANVEGEPSVTDTDTQTQQTETKTQTASDTEASPPPGTVGYAAKRDFYKFQVKLKKIHIDHTDKQSPKKKTEETKEDNTILHPMKAVICYPSNDTDPDRVCYISIELNHLSISERWETGNAECDVQLTVKLYWMLSESDYIKYNQLKRKNKRRNLSFNIKDLGLSFTPRIGFSGAVGNKDQQQQQHVRFIDIKSFFGESTAKNLHISRPGQRKKDYPWDQIRRLMFGYMAEVTYLCEIRIFEPFEIQNFPYDCQDIPIAIEPDNFHTLAPAHFGKKLSFVTVTGDATHLGRWSMENIICEFNNKTSNKTNALRIMLKLKRQCKPYLLEHVFLIAAVCFISLTAFTIDSVGDEIKHERLAIVLGLILTLIFIDLPAVPRVTLLHWYFYASFAFLTLLAWHFAAETYYSPSLLKILDYECYVDDDKCSVYQKNNYNALWFVLFGGLWIIYHIIFFIVSVTVNAEENTKLQMNSVEIKAKVEDEQWRILTHPVFKQDSTTRKRTYTRYGNVDLFGGYPDPEEQEDDGTMDKYKNNMMEQHRDFNRSKSEMTEVMERLIMLIFIVVSFVILPLAVSVLQFSLIEADECVVNNEFKTEQLFMILLSGIQAILCFSCVLFWFGCCAGPCAQSMFVYSTPICVMVIVVNYVLAIRSFVSYYWNEVNCNGWFEDLLYWMFLGWIVVYGFVISVTLLRMSFLKGFIERKGTGESKDSEVRFLKNRSEKWKSDIKPKHLYFVLKLGTSTVPIMVQYPATVILLLLVQHHDNLCNERNDIMSVYKSIALIVLSLLFHVIRALLHGNNAFYYYFTYFNAGNVAINILSIHALVFAETYLDNEQCKNSILYSALWWFMLIWVLYDNISIIGVLFEFIFNYAHIHFTFKPFLSTLIMCSALAFQLPPCIGQLYVVLKNDVQSSIQLDESYCTFFIGTIWFQILIYKIMQTKRFRNYAFIPMFLFVFLLFVISIKSFVFWILVSRTTVASVIFCIMFSFGIFFDVLLLIFPTFILPFIAYRFYGGITSKKNGMFRTMMLATLFFLIIQLPCCLMQLIPIWEGNVETISPLEGEFLLCLSWITLIIEYVYAYLYFDNNRRIREKVHPNMDFTPFKIWVKYLLFSVSMVIWVIIMHCFAFWWKQDFGGIIWWFLLIWISVRTIYSIIPALRIIWLMFCGQNKLERWINNAYVALAVFVYLFIQLPASFLQIAMIEFQRCFDQIDHTLDNSMAESFCILIFTFIQIILFYAICDIIGWFAEEEEHLKNLERDAVQDKVIEHQITHHERWNSDDWHRLGFESKQDYIKARMDKRKEIQSQGRAVKFRKYNGPIFYVAFIVIYLIQFGLAIHSFTYWDKKDNEIDCGCTYNTDTECSDDQLFKMILYILFLAWIIVYCLVPMAVVGLSVMRKGLTYKERKAAKKAESRERNQSDGTKPKYNKVTGASPEPNAVQPDTVYTV